MTIKQLGGVFGRNPTFNDVTIEGELTFDGDIDINSDLKVNGDLDVVGSITADNTSNIGRIELSTGTTSFIQPTNTGLGNMFIRSTADGVTYQGAGIDSGTTYAWRPSENGTQHLGVSNKKWNNLYLAGNVIVDSGKGIDFSATAGAGTSELFDDYEEGTWTAVDSSGAGVAIVSNYAVYTKIGNAVTISCYISVPAGAAGAVALLGGLPYAPATNNNVMVAHNNGGLDIIGRTNTSSFLVIYPSGSSSTTVWSSLAGNDVLITGTYYV